MKKFLVDDTEYYARTDGDGPIMLFAHGFPFDSRLFEPVVERLKSRFFCVVPDLRGFGMTKLGANGHDVRSGSPASFFATPTRPRIPPKRRANEGFSPIPLPRCRFPRSPTK